MKSFGATWKDWEDKPPFDVNALLADIEQGYLPSRYELLFLAGEFNTCQDPERARIMYAKVVKNLPVLYVLHEHISLKMMALVDGLYVRRAGEKYVPIYKQSE